MKTKGYILAAVSAISYGLIPLFILPVKAAGFSVNTTLFYRFLIAALCILGYLTYTKESLKLKKSEALTMFILGVLYAIGTDCLFLGYDFLTAGIASTIFFVYPVIVTFILAVFFKERVKLLTLLSLAVTLGGILVLSTKGSSLANINFFGLLITTMSAGCYAIYMIIVNKANISFSGIKMTFYSLFITSAYYLIKTQVLQESLVLPDVTMLFNFALFAFVTTVLSITTLIYAIKIIGSTPTAIMGALEPVVAIAISVILFHEKFTVSLLIGVVLIITGVLINILAEKRKEIV